MLLRSLLTCKFTWEVILLSTVVRRCSFGRFKTSCSRDVMVFPHFGFKESNSVSLVPHVFPFPFLRYTFLLLVFCASCPPPPPPVCGYYAWIKMGQILILKKERKKPSQRQKAVIPKENLPLSYLRDSCWVFYGRKTQGTESMTTDGNWPYDLFHLHGNSGRWQDGSSQ